MPLNLLAAPWLLLQQSMAAAGHFRAAPLLSSSQEMVNAEGTRVKSEGHRSGGQIELQHAQRGQAAGKALQTLYM